MIRQTSIDTYIKIESEGLLSKRRFEVYSELYKNGPLTRSEIARNISFIGYAGNVSARLTELRASGVVVEIGEKKCNVTDQQVILWDVTKNLPIEIKKQIKIKCQHCKGTGYEK